MHPHLDKNQLQQIRNGLKYHIDVCVYANPLLYYQEMYDIYRELVYVKHFKPKLKEFVNGCK